MNNGCFIGRLVNDPELKEFNGKKVAKFRFAVNRRFQKDKTDFFFCDCWSNPEALLKFAHKGDKLFVRGPVQIDEYTKQDGSKAVSVKINVEEFEFIDSNRVSNTGETQQTVYTKEDDERAEKYRKLLLGDPNKTVIPDSDLPFEV